MREAFPEAMITLPGKSYRGFGPDRRGVQA